VEDLGESEQTALGIRLAAVCRGKTLKNRILLVQGFKKLKEDLTGSSNSKSFSVKEITGTD
jgi:hypothetical protein